MTDKSLNELSADVLGSYAGKAGKASVKSAAKAKTTSHKGTKDFFAKRAEKRKEGYKKATGKLVDKLSKEDLEVGLVLVDEDGTEVEILDVTEEGVTITWTEGEDEFIDNLSVDFILEKWKDAEDVADKDDKKKKEKDRSSARKFKAKSKCNEETLEEDSPALSSLHPGTSPSGDPKEFSPAHRVALLKKMIGDFYGVSDGGDPQSAAIEPGEGGHIAGPDSAGSNKASINAKGDPKVIKHYKEAVTELFTGTELSEEFKEKAATLFEAAVNAKVLEREVEIAEAFAEALTDELDALQEAYETEVSELNEKVETYADYVAVKFVEENELAIESAIKTEIAENLLEGLKSLLDENYIQVPDDKEDLFDSLSERVEELEAKYDEVLQEKVDLQKAIVAIKENELFSEVGKGLALTEIEKLKTLSEDVSFDGDEDKFKEKVALIREAHFNKSTKAATKGLIFEDSIGITESKKFVSPEMQRYANAIGKK